MNSKILAPSCVICAGILWGAIGLFSNPLNDMGLSPLQITELRCMVTSVVLITVALIKDKNLLKIKLKDIWMFIGTGVCSIVFFNVCYFTAIQESTLSIACTLLYTGPCFVLVLSSILFHEKFTGKKALSLVMAVCGCAFITGLLGGSDGLAISPYAFLVGLGSGLGYGLYSIFGHVALQKYNWLTVVTYTFSFAAISLIPFCHYGEIGAIVAANGISIIHILCLGLLCTLTPFLLYTKGLDLMEAGKAAIFAFFDPLFATIVGVAVFHEGFTFTQGIGMLLIITAITMINIKFKRPAMPFLRKCTQLITHITQ